MGSWGMKTGSTFARRALALLACSLLLYFVAGSLLHQHTGGPDTVCHICQALHLPVLASTSLDLVATPELIARYSSHSQHAVPSDSVSLHRASRAPPLA
jgi:hypothetical protein